MVDLPPGARYLVTLVLENELHLAKGDELQLTTRDGRLSLATVANAPMDLLAIGSRFDHE